MDEYESVSDMTGDGRRLTRQRVQRHRGRTDEARRETVRAADRKRKRLGRQNEVDVHRSQRLTIAHDYVLLLPNYIKASREASLRGQPRIVSIDYRMPNEYCDSVMSIFLWYGEILWFGGRCGCRNTAHFVSVHCLCLNECFVDLLTLPSVQYVTQHPCTIM